MVTQYQSSAWTPRLSGPSRQRALDACESIARDLAELGAPRLAAREVLDVSLATGGAGIALFLHYASEPLGNVGFRVRALEIIDSIISELPRLALDPGLYTGVAGVGWLVAHLQSRGERELASLDLSDVDRLLTSAIEHPERIGYDLMRGLTGIGVYHVARLGSSSADGVIASLVRKMTSHPVTELPWPVGAAAVPVSLAPHDRRWYRSMRSAAHGAAGAVAFVARCQFAKNGGDDMSSWTRGSLSLLCAATHVRQRRARANLASDTNTGADQASWCFGDVGIALALAQAAHALRSPRRTRLAQRILLQSLDSAAESFDTMDPCLCHGTAGIAHTVARFASITRDPSAERTAVEWYERTLALRRFPFGIGGFVFDTWRDRIRTSAPSAGFLQGSAGVGLALLAASTATIPSWDQCMLADITQ